MTSLSSTKGPPAVSVLMPAYNAEPFLAEAIESVLAQRFGDFELLIHDDGSTDRTPEIIAQYAARDPRIVASRGTNAGISNILNLLIERARADLLARMDADDICLPERLHLQLDYLARNPDCVLLGAAYIIMDEKARPIRRDVPPANHDEIDGLHLRARTSINHPTVMMRKAAVLACGGYDPTIRATEDLDLWLRLAEIGRIANLSDVLLKYRVHGASISGIKRGIQREAARRVCAAACARRGVEASFDYSDWRMDDTRASRLEFYLRYGWQAWNSGYRATRRHYAWQSVRIAPLSRDAWSLLIAGALRRPAREKETSG